ncbi:Protein of unknown function DUF1867 [Methanosalsum zhilinae DSM 4017]|uniref:Pyruvate kinase C-terminal domain-containing protein n=1 Tax=Methanosalsum zhilinae (strain DSM 4017 / NBRC 107636 / OCM 62 / WeN5) TaxID=679901 RepID=F7XNM0_METZD|nr:pyruvate kinase alpha/beta domain-containing protein [Methanosalsum zhilinae]AEH60117.1 Protein of unknown function DUF1867 [Methanosalsum zhilinae DSM 4017]
MEKNIQYFDEVGEKNTDQVIEDSLKRAKELGIAYIVVASTSGETALKLARKAEQEKMGNIRIIAVSHQYGLREEGKWEMNEENMEKLEDMGVVVTTQSHMFSGIERAVSNRLGGASRLDVISDTLRALFGKGFKVAVEVTIMAADSGHIPVSKDLEIIAIGGTRHGADVSVVIRPAHSKDFFSNQIREIIAMPREKEE